MKLSDFNRIMPQYIDNPDILDDLAKLFEALQAYQDYNGLGNDRDAYLFRLGEWAFGEDPEKPDKKDYGL